MQWSGPRWGSVSASLTALTSLWVGSLVALGTDEFLVEWQAGDAIMTTQWQGEGGRYMKRGSLPDTERCMSYLGQRGKLNLDSLLLWFAPSLWLTQGVFQKFPKYVACLKPSAAAYRPSWRALGEYCAGSNTYERQDVEVLLGGGHLWVSLQKFMTIRVETCIFLRWEKVPSHIDACKENHKLRHVFTCF